MLWSYNSPINAYSDKTYVDFKVKYKNVVTTYEGKVQSDLNFTHTSDELHTGIKSNRHIIVNMRVIIVLNT